MNQEQWWQQLEHWWRVWSRATTTGGAWFHAPLVNSEKQGWRQICSFSSSSCRRWPPRRPATQETTQTQLGSSPLDPFVFFFFFSSAARGGVPATRKIEDKQIQKHKISVSAPSSLLSDLQFLGSNPKQHDISVHYLLSSDLPFLLQGMTELPKVACTTKTNAHITKHKAQNQFILFCRYQIFYTSVASPSMVGLL